MCLIAILRTNSKLKNIDKVSLNILFIIQLSDGYFLIFNYYFFTCKSTFITKLLNIT